MAVIVCAALFAPVLRGQAEQAATIVVRESAGIARTQYPVTARVRVPRGALADAARVRLREGGTDVAVQATAESRWDDRSVQTLALDFNVTLGPVETRTYSLAYGATVEPAPAPPRGLTVSDDTETIQIGSMKFSKAGSPLVVSANYRAEFIGKGSNGLVLTDTAGRRYDLSNAQPLETTLVKRGPLNALLRYAGEIAIDGGSRVPVVLAIEMPNSKSWAKMTATIDDRARRVRDIAFETPLAYGDFPWLWDFGTDSGTYGALRTAADEVVLTQTVSAKGSSWRVETGSKGELRPYETSAGRRPQVMPGWGHFLDSRGAVAFGVDRFAERAGTYTISFNGQGQAAFRFAPAAPAERHELTLYQHFVSTPVPVGAATNPTAMLHPPLVEIR